MGVRNETVLGLPGFCYASKFGVLYCRRSNPVITHGISHVRTANRDSARESKHAKWRNKDRDGADSA